MQKKNDNSKVKIKNSAKKLFFIMQYKDVSMRDVAKMSDMTVGNIYRYYENKELLFEEIVGDCYKKIEKLIRVSDYAKVFIHNKIGLNEKNVYKNSKFKLHILDTAANVVVENANELYILLNNSLGSKYENIVDKVKNMVIETISSLISDMKKERADVYASMLLYTLSYILKNFIEDKKKLKEEVEYFFKEFIDSLS